MIVMKFEDLKIRQLSELLVVEVYEMFGSSKDYGFKDQIQRASVSVMNNIAEWFERWTLKDRQRFLIIAKWSVGEVRSMLHIALQLQYLTWKDYERLVEMCLGLSAGIHSFSINMKF